MSTRSVALLACALVLACSNETTGSGSLGDVLASPSNVRAEIVDGNLVMTWDSVPGATSYHVYMASEPGVKKSNLQQLLDNMSHPDLGLRFDHPPGLSTNLQYFLVVTAVGPNGESAGSCEVSATIGSGTGSSC